MSVINRYTRVLTLAILIFALYKPSTANGQITSFGFKFDGRILVPVQVDGGDPLDVILDSGLGNRFLMLTHVETGQELGLSYARTIPGARGAGSGANKDIHLTKENTLSLPGLEIGRLPVAVMDESRDVSSFHSAGVLGGAVFIPYVVEIDFETSTITLHDPDAFSSPEGWEVIEIDFGRNLPILETTVSIDGKAEIPVRLIVDTGGKPPLALVLNEELGITAPKQTLWSLSGTGLRGDVFAEQGRVSAVRVGAHTLKHVVSGFWTGDEAPALAEVKANGVLGMGALHHFNLIFDYPHRRLFLKPNRYFGEPFERNMAGMTLEKTPEGRTVVYWVDEGSEAEARGLQKGDVVEQVNGKAVDEHPYLELKKLFEVEGSKVQVEVRRDGQARKVTLALRRSI